MRPEVCPPFNLVHPEMMIGGHGAKGAFAHPTG